ncbi:hypothetical protein [Yinghuangia sp. YIM S09857]|uniref:hypothetical protein n=1 Tax=Yinghuangia sp. YIM S09857 TaxID=3436929 RepID=UPI003F538393
MSPPTLGALLGAALLRLGAPAVYGDPLAGVRTATVKDPALARLMAFADARAHARTSWVHSGGRLIAVDSSGRSLRLPHRATDADSLVASVEMAVVGGGEVALHLDLRSPAPAGAFIGSTTSAESPPQARQFARRLTAAHRPIVLAGHGVLAARTVPALRAIAAAGRVGVLNTWSAKGVLPWESPYHLGTFGLQERDLALANLPGYDLIIQTGLVVGELPGDPLRGLPSVTVPAALLPALADQLQPRVGPATTSSDLRNRLAAVVQSSWDSRRTPLPPAVLTRQYSDLLGDRGLVTADAGTPGFFVGRTFPTLRPGSVVLPPAGVAAPAGFAVAAALARLRTAPASPVLAVIHARSVERVDAATAEVLGLAAEWRLRVPVACWSPEGPGLSAQAHLEEVVGAVHGTGPSSYSVGYDRCQERELEAVAGPITAW